MTCRMQLMEAKMSLGYEKSKAMLETGLLSDCQFEVQVKGGEPQILKAHKNQLVYASEVLKEMFLSRESGDNGPIIVTDISPVIFQKLLLYIYTYELELKSGQEAVELALAAEKYKIADLKLKCIEFIKLNFDRKEIWDIILLVEPLGDSSLQEICKVLIMEHAEECLSFKSFLNVPRKVVLEILQYDTMNITSELILIRACVSWAKNNIGAEQTLRDEMLPFLPHLRLLSLKSKEFAEGPAQQEWLTPEEKNFIFSYMASSTSTSMAQITCSPSIEPRKKPNCHIYSGVFCVASDSKLTISVPNNDLKYNLSGFQFCLQEKVMPNIYVHDIKVYTMINGEGFKKVVRSSTFKDGQNYLVTLHLAEYIMLDHTLDYKFMIKVWRQDGKESIYLQPDFENVDLGAGKMGFFLLIKCGNLFENTISKIESIIINIEQKKKKKTPVLRGVNGHALKSQGIPEMKAGCAMSKEEENGEESAEDEEEYKENEEESEEEEDIDSALDDVLEPEEPNSSARMDSETEESRSPESDKQQQVEEEDDGLNNSSPLAKVIFSQVEEMREIKDPMIMVQKITAHKKHLPHMEDSVQRVSHSADGKQHVRKRTNSEKDERKKIKEHQKKARKHDNRE